MQNLKRFVTYIYSYINDEKAKNTGFAKIDCRSDYARIEIQIKDETEEKCNADLYLLVKDNMKLLGLKVGVISFDKGMGSYRGRIPLKNIAQSGYDFEMITGMYFKNVEKIYASQWIDEDLSPSVIELLEKPIKVVKSIDQDVQPKQSIMEEKMLKAVQKDMKATEVPEPTLRVTEEKPQYDWRYEWEKLDQNPDQELVFGLAFWTRNKGKP